MCPNCVYFIKEKERGKRGFCTCFRHVWEAFVENGEIGAGFQVRNGGIVYFKVDKNAKNYTGFTKMKVFKSDKSVKIHLEKSIHARPA